MAKKTGRQTPTKSVVLPYKKTTGLKAIKMYELSGRKALPWQKSLVKDIMARNEDGLWVHTKFGLSVPRRNGKNEVVVIRELAGLIGGEKILHTAHRTTTSHSAFERLCECLRNCGYKEVSRKSNDAPLHSFIASKQFGLERITLLDEGGGTCDFRTRTSQGGLGEGFDLLVIDEAQEYEDTQETALKYVVSDSQNPQTILTGTPPTAVSKGTVFQKLREKTLSGEAKNGGWAEWSVETQTDPHDVKAWYETNPSMGYHLNERKIEDEIGDDDIDFNIQRLGLWLSYNQASAITDGDWNAVFLSEKPELKGSLFVGIKYGHNGKNVALSVAVKTADKHIFVETVDCRPIRSGNDWILSFLSQTKPQSVIVDGANGQSLLAGEMKDAKLQVPVFPKVAEIVEANALFEQNLFGKVLQHAGQPSLKAVATNCKKRAIGSNGGFGYEAINADEEISLLDSVILASWACSKTKEKRKQRISY